MQGVSAEKFGFDSVWVPDHLTDIDGCKVDPWTVLAAIGVQTRKVFLCPGVTDILRCHPAKTAQIVSTLDELSGGRAGLGIGAGEGMNIIPFGMAWEKASVRIQRLKEALEVAKLLWSSSKDNLVNYQGEHYRLDRACLDQAPTQTPHPPIYIGALGSPRALRLVGELGNGWLSWISTPELFEKRLSIVHEWAGKVGRTAKEIDAVAWLYVALSDDTKVIERAMNIGKALLVTERGVLTSTENKAPPSAMSAQEILASRENLSKVTELARDVPDKIVNDSIAVGNADRCIELIDRFIRSGATHVAIRDLATNSEKGLKVIAEEVIPYFKEGSRR
jgi:alkanesulfonate monooxygenase SsuD/methylene tetrahydromethanopterin reductase-like flavin-dependent oxidoreductase (luciferase family)